MDGPPRRRGPGPPVRELVFSRAPPRLGPGRRIPPRPDRRDAAGGGLDRGRPDGGVDDRKAGSVKRPSSARAVLNRLAPFLGLLLVLALFSLIPEVQARFLRPANFLSVAT